MRPNGTMIQYFEWYLPPDGQYWNHVSAAAPKLREHGITSIWLPPAYKGAQGREDTGYAVYDLYDLGEFDQKGGVPTKYGTKEDYLHAVKELQRQGISVYADIVLNHHMGADETEEISVEEVSGIDRNQVTSGQETIRAWTKYIFPGRAGCYSDFQWDHTHFNGIDWDENSKQNRIYRFTGKQWEGEVDEELGNYDYLMGADVDFNSPAVLEELSNWGKWYLDTTGVDGLRLDAIKHINADFYQHWLPMLREHTGKELFVVGEYWSADAGILNRYMEWVDYNMSLFDVPLHFHLYDASVSGRDYDLRKIFDNTLTGQNPIKAVTFVDNHDTQPGQALMSFVREWFRLPAYALILLREGGYPCVFYGDYYGIPHDGIPPLGQLELLLTLRRDRAYGIQHDYFDDPCVIGWTREGCVEYPASGLAVLISSRGQASKRMYVGKQFAGRTFRDALDGCRESVIIEEDGNGTFLVGNAPVSVWMCV